MNIREFRGAFLVIALIAIVGLLATHGLAKQPTTSVGVECNWGQLTATAKGRGHSVGNLQATCDFIEGFTESHRTGPVVTAVSLKCNWGKLTMEIVPLGEHSSDPSGDGRGPEDRVGLANLVERGNMHATCEFLSNLPPP